MNVLVAAPLYPPEIGGPATHAVFVERELPRRGVHVAVLPFLRVRPYPKLVRHVLYAGLLLRAARKADVMYVLDPISVGVPALIASTLTRTPYVLRVGGDYAWEQGVQRFGIAETLDDFLEKKKHPFFVRMLQFLQALVARRAHRVIAPSEYLRGVIERWGVDLSRINVAYSTLEPLPAASRAEARKRLGIHENETVISSAGRLVPWKGFLALIEAFERYLATNPTARLVIAGDGPQEEELRAYIVSRSLEAVDLLGRISRTSLADVLAASDVFVLNTRYEGLSHQLLEAFMAHVPVITTNAGGNTELVEDEVNGLLISFNDTEALVRAIDRVIADRTLASRLCAGGELRLKRFDQDQSLSVIEETLRTTL